MAAVYMDGSYTSAFAISAAVYEAPFEHTTELLILRQRFCQAKANKTALPLNTEHATATDFFLVSEGPETDLGEGICEWERIYAKKPSSYTEPDGLIAYQFVGLTGTWGVGVEPATGRERFTRLVPVVVTHDFFLVGTSGGGLETPDFATAMDIPLEQPTRYYFALSNETLETDYLTDFVITPTTPTRTEYLDLVADDESSQDSYSIIVESPVPTRWMGNIWRRVIMRIKAI